MVSLNLLLGGLIAMVLLFISILLTLTYCVMQSFEKATSELGNSDNEESSIKARIEEIGSDGNPVLESDTEEFVF